ncbi:hypothetical protein EXIGLDRAFT_728357 [Exidia glandulosa HHB12029]|uniref:DUF6533 domain-containing protein n=1 Tax=Exidia glandulosa HHB12029 TaxID=1314781 RepID=A0A165LUL5_EXIGL|nr:hypothetical protein EXIGLDRAFT_728357 [Exidia glandulosa HHB12029]
MPHPVGTSTGYLRLIAFSMFFYDFALTFEDEVLHIWRQKWTTAKILFLLLRYVTCAIIVMDTVCAMVSGLSPQTCSWYPNIAAFGLVIIIILVQIILMLRVYVLYERRRAMLWTNIALFVGEFGATMVVLVREFPKSVALTAPDWVIGSCYSMHPTSMSYGFIAPLLFESYLAGLAMYKLVHEQTSPLSGPSILTLLVRDSVIYFIFIAAVMGLNVILFIAYPVVPGFASVGIVDAAGAIGGTRLILSMHNATFDDSRNRIRRFSGQRLSLSNISTTAHFQVFNDEVEHQDETIVTARGGRSTFTEGARSTSSGTDRDYELPPFRGSGFSVRV